MKTCIKITGKTILGCGAIAALLAIFPSPTARAADADAIAESSSISDYFGNWFARVDKTRSEQPHWAPAVATTSPALQEVVRYDIMWQNVPAGHTLTTFGSGKGLELIPAERVQLIIGLPPWQNQSGSTTKDGWGDESFLIKYRLASANEENGNYVVTTFLGLTAPTGGKNISQHRFGFTPTLAGGKGWGDFDIQSTLGVTIPDNGSPARGPGTPVVMNTALQYRIDKVIWPEIEANYTWWPDGAKEGHNQLFMTPGFVLGKFPVWNRLGMMIGAGYQIALSERPAYRQNFILTARLPF